MPPLGWAGELDEAVTCLEGMKMKERTS